MTIEFGHMDVTGVLNKSRLNVGVGTEVQLDRLRTHCEGRAISKSSCCIGEQKNGAVATGGCVSLTESCF